MYQVAVEEEKIAFLWSMYILQFLSKELAICYSPLCKFHAGTDVQCFLANSVIPKRSYLGIHQLKEQRDVRRPKRGMQRQF
jgi:hypothetical protein